MQKPDVASSTDDSTNSDIAKENVVLPIAVEDTRDRLIVVRRYHISEKKLYYRLLHFCICAAITEIFKLKSEAASTTSSLQQLILEFHQNFSLLIMSCV